MPLIKKSTIHESMTVRILGEHAGMSVDEMAARINEQEQEKYFARLTEEERQKEIDQVVGEAQQQAQGVIGAAQTQAQKVAADAQTEAERIIAEAQGQAAEILEREKGKGIELGKEIAAKQLQGLVAEAQEAIQQAKRQRNAIVKSAVPEILKLAVKVAGQVVNSEIKQTPDIIMNIVRDAIEKISDNEQVVIKVAQHDLQTVRNQKDRIVDLIGAKNLSIVADRNTAEGGCMIETKLGFIDARVLTKLEMIEHALLAIYNEEKGKKETVLREKQERGEDVNIEQEEVVEVAEMMREVQAADWPAESTPVEIEAATTEALNNMPVAEQPAEENGEALFSMNTESTEPVA